MEQEFLTGKCPKCMQELRVPASLAEFSCMYCGARLAQGDLVTEAAETPAAPDADAYAAALEELSGCIRNYRGFHKRVTKTDYVPAFDEYEAGCRAVVVRLDAGLAGLPADARAAQLRAAAGRMIDDLAVDWAARKGNRFLFDEDKYVVALFFVPMVLRQELPSGREFADTLQAVWVERYPKSPFYVGDYETLVGGFRKKKFLGLCFITTAVCEAEGKPDDCAELTAFRAFRDGYLKAQPDGAALIEEYYRIAPTIVMCIDVCGDRDARYAAIREQYLQPCYNALQAGDLAGCKTKYVRMVRDLEREYLS